jgi:hypothetical protein
LARATYNGDNDELPIYNLTFDVNVIETDGRITEHATITRLFGGCIPAVFVAQIAVLRVDKRVVCGFACEKKGHGQDVQKNAAVLRYTDVSRGKRVGRLMGDCSGYMMVVCSADNCS